jgi:hypothetical protein
MRRHYLSYTLALLLAAAAPTLTHAQNDTQNTTQSRERDANGEWGWLGLLGLVGLIGLKRRDRHEDTTHHHAAVR